MTSDADAKQVAGPGSLPDGYTSLTLLNQRGTVEVHRARRERGDEVVLRIDRGPSSAESQAELAVLAAVDHPGIAALVDHGTHGGHSYLARTWVEGEDLLAWSEGRSPEEIGEQIARLCPTLEHLHRLGFVHADLKPENVIVTPESRPILCDFGLSRSGDETGEIGVSGTLFSIAPEVILGQPPTPSSDLFALGAMLHRLLTGTRTTAREFYAAFPQRSFLDAVGSRPEDLPGWARDLVVALTTRDPARRPKSAAAVGRLLFPRLGFEPDADALAEELHWPVGYGRDGWLTEWLRGAQSESSENDLRPQWIRLPALEEPGPFWDHLRLFATLRGVHSHGLELARERARLRNTAALDRWARELAQEETGWIIVACEDLEPWTRRILEVLARAIQHRRVRRAEGDSDQEAPRLFVVSAEDAPSSDIEWDLLEVTPVTEADVVSFLQEQFPDEEAERRAEYAARLHLKAAGSATLLDALLTEAERVGRVLGQGGGFRLRPGPIPDPTLPQGGEAATEGPEVAWSPAATQILAALFVCGGRASAEELSSLLELDAPAFGQALVELTSQGAIRRAGNEDPPQLVAAQRTALQPADSSQAQRLHGLRAEYLGNRDRGDLRVLAHRLCAEPTPEVVAQVREEIALLRDRGCAELALQALERIEESAEPLGISLADEAPELLIEEAFSWCEIGQTEHALRTIEKLSIDATPAITSRVELVRSNVAAQRHQANEALAHCERAVELDPGAKTEAERARLELLHTMGRDREVSELFHAPDASWDRLPRRKQVHVESVAAMSAFRLGEIDQARDTLTRLVGDAQALGDVGVEAPLRINLATIERRGGSLARAKEELERCIELFEGAGVVYGIAQAKATLGGLLRELGELIEAEPLLAASMETRVRLGDVDGANTIRGMLGLLHFERGHARAAVESLRNSESAMSEAQRRRFGPLLRAKADEMEARLGVVRSEEGDSREEEADPRILISKARAAWLRDDAQAAESYADRAASLAASLKLGPSLGEAELLGALLRHERPQPKSDQAYSLAVEDQELLHLLGQTGDDFDVERAIGKASDLEARGRDDRAARLWSALAARLDDPERSALWAERAETCLKLCAAGLTEEETLAFRSSLLGIPDPWPGDFAVRPDQSSSEEEFEMEVTSLLEINKQLLQQRELGSLLGMIVEHALSFTGAERGFLMLEEKGQLRFDTALDSCRGDIARPEFEISRSVVLEALERGETIRVSNAVDDPLLGHTNSVVSLELRSILCVPIEISDDLRGAIYVDHRLRNGAFDERAERLCALLANQAALAIQQMSRLNEIKKLNQRLEHRVIEQQSDLESARNALREAGLNTPVTGLIGRSDAMQRAHSLLERAGPADIPVLIAGESGTGKDLAAGRLHELSPRSNGPFVSENCAALPPSLIEAELFGYRKGAFTGADRDRQGVFERADGGTLFLDEIGELPLDLQAKLLRVLELGEIRRLGDTESRSVDFRLVVATNRDLEREVREGRFREDLFFRLDGLRIEMPPLRDRTEDIPELTEHFLDMQAQKDGIRRKISKSVMTRLCRRPWPGNVRQLKNEVARLCVLSEGDLSDPALVRDAASMSPAADSAGVDVGLVPLSELEKQAIHNALEHTNGDKRKAAEILGISRAKIYQRLKEWSESNTEAAPEE